MYVYIYIYAYIFLYLALQELVHDDVQIPLRLRDGGALHGADVPVVPAVVLDAELPEELEVHVDDPERGVHRRQGLVGPGARDRAVDAEGVGAVAAPGVPIYIYIYIYIYV